MSFLLELKDALFGDTYIDNNKNNENKSSGLYSDYLRYRVEEEGTLTFEEFCKKEGFVLKKIENDQTSSEEICKRETKEIGCSQLSKTVNKILSDMGISFTEFLDYIQKVIKDANTAFIDSVTVNKKKYTVGKDGVTNILLYNDFDDVTHVTIIYNDHRQEKFSDEEDSSTEISSVGKFISGGFTLEQGKTICAFLKKYGAEIIENFIFDLGGAISITSPSVKENIESLLKDVFSEYIDTDKEDVSLPSEPVTIDPVGKRMKDFILKLSEEDLYDYFEEDDPISPADPIELISPADPIPPVSPKPVTEAKKTGRSSKSKK